MCKWQYLGIFRSGTLGRLPIFLDARRVEPRWPSFDEWLTSLDKFFRTVRERIVLYISNHTIQCIRSDAYLRVHWLLCRATWQ